MTNPVQASPLPPMHSSTRDLVQAGRALRKRVPRRSLAERSSEARDPLGILAEQNATRVNELVPLRTARMSASPFTFYRGGAAIMAADLGSDPHTGIKVASCGDAHVSNFGFYASPQRTLLFDLNDFDESAWAPWEWDLKRLVTSIIVAGRSDGRSRSFLEKVALRTTEVYLRTLARSLERSPLTRYYTHLDAEAGAGRLDPASREVLRRAVKASRRRTGERAIRRLTRADEAGRLRFVPSPPTMMPLEEGLRTRVHGYIRAYERSAAPDLRVLLAHYVHADSIRRAVGVGSVGTRCSLTLLQDGDGGGLILQSKEAGRSVLEQYGGIRQPPALTRGIREHGQGYRVVALQRIIQSTSDPFLGYLRADGIDLYVRQFHDMKGGIDTDGIDDAPFRTYAEACAVTLARAHSQSPAAAAIVGYAGGGAAVAEAILEWSTAYADQVAIDHAAFVQATTTA